jgi:ubiquinone/menaquinone biosynthesis C-methylase UbiE
VRIAERDYVPAAPQLWLYDALVVALARAWRWRRDLLDQIGPREGDVIADVGCGTGTQLVKIGRAARGVTLIGIDPDPDVL